MRLLLAVFGCSLLAAPAFADASGRCDKAFETGFLAGGKLSIHIRPGDIDITGADVSTVRVSCTTSQSDEILQRISIRFHANGNSGTLDIEGGSSHNSGIHFRVEIPRRSNLYVRSNAGAMKVANIAGDKDIELYAGELHISVGDPKDYSHVDASLMAGNLTATAFNVSKDGLFRSFSQDNAKGKYKLHAHLMAGDLFLQ